LGNVVDILPKMIEMKVKPDIVTDQTSAHDPVNGYLPSGWSIDEWDKKRKSHQRTTV